MAVGHFAVSFRFFGVSPLVMLRGLAVVMRCRFVIERGVAVMGGQTTFAPDLGHVLPIATHGFASASPRLGSFLAVKLMGRPPFVGSPPALTGDLPLFLGIHRCKTSPTLHHNELLHWKRLSDPPGNSFRAG